MANQLTQLEAHLAKVAADNQLGRALTGHEVASDDAMMQEASAYLATKSPAEICQLVSDAGDRHSENTGELHIIGDLQEALSLALGLLTREQMASFIAQLLDTNTELQQVLDDA